MMQFRLLMCAGMLLLIGSRSMSQDSGDKTGASSVKGFRGEFIAQLDGVEKKLVDLANAVPQEKYSWRPGEGVRSVSEVYVHVAGSNYFLLSFAGVKPPAGLSRDMEKTVTQKADVVEALKKSFSFVRDAVMKMRDDDLDKPETMFGQKTTVRGVLLTLGLHMQEHLGQSIAYARMNSVVPPWTAEQMKNANPKKD